MREVRKYAGCFVCGDKNEAGLKARFFFDGTSAFTKITAERLFEGYSGIYHGGVIAALLDEVMIKAILAEDHFVVTAEMTVRFHAPVRIGDHLRFSGRATSRKGRIFTTEGEAVGEDGTVYATASGKYIEAREELRAELQKSLE